MAKRIMATVVGDFTNYTKTVDVTNAVLSMPAYQRQGLRDNDRSSDVLVSAALEAMLRDIFTAVYGTETQDVQFGFTVYVEKSIATYFSTP